MFFRIMLFLAELFGEKNVSSYRRIYAVADWHNGETLCRSVTLNSQVRTMETWVLLGKMLHWTESTGGGPLLTLNVTEDARAREVEDTVKKFLLGANPEGFPLRYETAEGQFPELVRRAVAFLTRESQQFVWGGWRTCAS